MIQSDQADSNHCSKGTYVTLQGVPGSAPGVTSRRAPVPGARKKKGRSEDRPKQPRALSRALKQQCQRGENRLSPSRTRPG